MALDSPAARPLNRNDWRTGVAAAGLCLAATGLAAQQSARPITPFVGLAVGPGMVIRTGPSDWTVVNPSGALAGGDAAVTIGLRFRSPLDVRVGGAYWLDYANRRLTSVFAGPVWRVGPRRAAAVAVAIGVLSLPVDVDAFVPPPECSVGLCGESSVKKTRMRVTTGGLRVAGSYEWPIQRTVSVQVEASWAATFPIVGRVEDAPWVTVGQVAYHHLALRIGMLMFLAGGPASQSTP